MKSWQETIPDIIKDFERRIEGNITPASRLTRDTVFDMLFYDAWGSHTLTWDDVNAWFEQNRPDIPGRGMNTHPVPPVTELTTFQPGKCENCGTKGEVKYYWFITLHSEKASREGIHWCEGCSFQVIGYLASSWGQEMTVKQKGRKRT